MRELKIIDVDNSTLIVAHPDGEEFRVPVDAVALHRLRGARSETETVRVSPKDVQAHIRAGMSSEEVAALTGASLDFIARFEGPVLAEREFIINSALAVETQATVDLETGDTSSAFGALIRSRLREVGASGERWASWKEADGSWVVKLSFEAATIDHDARWSFEPRKHALSPLNSDASTLSQKGDMTTGIIPRLRAVPGDSGIVAHTNLFTDTEHRDSALATVSHLEFAVTTTEVSAVEPPAANDATDEFTYETNVFVGVADLFSTSPVDVREESIHATGTSPTADLLEALRRRRGERESTPAWLLRDERESTAADVATSPSSDVPDTAGSIPPAEEKSPSVGIQRTGSHAKRERATMPSWDEIVFGTRSEEDTL